MSGWCDDCSAAACRMAIEHTLTHPRDPLWTALTAPWPWAGSGVATFVLDEVAAGQQLRGFVQLMQHAARPEADLLHLAPALSAGTDDAGAVIVWSRLLNHCTMASANHGLQRIFASIPDGAPGQTSLRDAGFSLYTRETVYRLAGRNEGNSQAGFRQQGPGDGWALQRLCTRATLLGWFSRRKGRSRVRWDHLFSLGGSRTVGKVSCGSLPVKCAAPCRCISAGLAIGCVYGARPGWRCASCARSLSKGCA